MNELAQTLESLLDHPGWRMFTQYVTHEWGAHGVKYNAELDRALDLTDPAMAASQARQVRAGRVVIETLINWPAEEIARLKRQEQQPEFSQSRRGSL